MNLVLRRIEVVEQALSVKRAAGSSDGDKYFQGRRMVDPLVGKTMAARRGMGKRLSESA
jgi:hypothetical protein